MTDSIEILSHCFDTNSLIHEDWCHAKECESKTVKFDANRNRLDTDSKSLLPWRIQTSPALKQAKSSVSDIDTLVKQLQNLLLNQAQLMAMMTTSMNSALLEQCSPMQQNSGWFFLCGKWNAHPLHSRYCQEMMKLIEERQIKYNVNPQGFYGGVVDWL